MELNNDHIRAMLAESDMQGFGDRGFLTYSPIRDISTERAKEIFNVVRKGVQKGFNELQEKTGGVEVGATAFVNMALDSIELNGLPELLHFLWVCGQTFKEADMKLNALKQLEESERSEEQGSLMETAIQLDNGLLTISQMFTELPVPEFWPGMKEWLPKFQQVLDKQREYIRRLM
jgi:hypothetical protein